MRDQESDWGGETEPELQSNWVFNPCFDTLDGGGSFSFSTSLLEKEDGGSRTRDFSGTGGFSVS